VSYSFVAYERAGGTCSGGPEPGTAALLAWLRQYAVAGRSGGIYNCRNIRGTNNSSVHSEGRAVDWMMPVGSNGRGTQLGHRLVDLLGRNAQDLGLQYIIYDRRAWSRRNPNGSAYNGVHPHFDHLHIEQSKAAAKIHTLATVRRILGSTHTPTNTEAEDMKELIKSIQRAYNKAGITGLNGKPLVVDGIWGPQTEGAFNKTLVPGGNVGSSGPIAPPKTTAGSNVVTHAPSLPAWRNKRLRAIADRVNFYDTQRWNNPSGHMKKGQHFPVIEGVVTTSGAKQYRVRNSRGAGPFYLTTRADLVQLVD